MNVELQVDDPARWAAVAFTCEWVFTSWLTTGETATKAAEPPLAAPQLTGRRESDTVL
jgi:hypothetical protein